MARRIRGKQLRSRVIRPVRELGMEIIKPKVEENSSKESSSLTDNPVLFLINSVKYPKSALQVYTDASYKDGIGASAYLVYDPKTGNQVLHSCLVPEGLLKYCAPGCELYSAAQAIKFASTLSDEFVLHFDYVGVFTECHPRAGLSELAKWYKEQINPFVSGIYFHKVVRGNHYHDIVDTVSKLLVHNVTLIRGGNSDRCKQLLSKGKELAGE